MTNLDALERTYSSSAENTGRSGSLLSVLFGGHFPQQPSSWGSLYTIVNAEVKIIQSSRLKMEQLWGTAFAPELPVGLAEDFLEDYFEAQLLAVALASPPFQAVNPQRTLNRIMHPLLHLTV